MWIGVDTGGTFTDLVAYDGHSVRTFKVPSTPDDYTRGVWETIDAVVQDDTPSFVLIHSSTVATNALLEHNVARAALIATKGFRDVPAIGRQSRPDLYDMTANRPPPLIQESLRREVNERVTAEGKVLRPVSEQEVGKLLDALQQKGIESLAISLLFSFLRPSHERLIARLARERGLYVSRSSDIVPEFREYERTSTTIINACVSPVMTRYLSRLSRQAKRRGAAGLRIVQSNGGSLSASAAGATAVHTLLSGPAAGVVGAFAVAKKALRTDAPRCITFDMGGTSTDVALLDGDIPVQTESRVGGYPVRVPMMDIHTVGAGGGSIARCDPGGGLLVGPKSAGAAPGPACYGVGTQPTVTDANVIMGRIVPDAFLGGRKALSPEKARAAYMPLARKLGVDIEAAAQSVLRIVNANMERAIRVISVERGYDPRSFTLLSFGGAGGLHACELAASMQVGRVLIPRHPGVLSAWGALSMDVIKDFARTVMWCKQDSRSRGPVRVYAQLEERALTALKREGYAAADVRLQRLVDMRYVGQSHELTVPLDAAMAWDQQVEQAEWSFHKAHRHRYGHAETDQPVQWVTVRVRAVGPTRKPRMDRIGQGGASAKRACVSRRHAVAVYDRARLRAGNRFDGPALIVEDFATTWIPKGWSAKVDAWGHVMLEGC